MADSMPQIPLALLRQFSHDLRSPLGATLATSDMFATGMYGDLNEKQQRAINRLQRNSQRMVTLLDDFTTYCKAAFGEYPLKLDFFSPADLLQEVIQEIQPALLQKNLTFSAEFEGLPPQLKGDQLALRKVLRALLWNAVDFTATGGITLITNWEGGLWQVGISDTGIGVADEQQALIFEPFWQGGAKPELTPSARFGLGLSIARALARIMGGEVVLVSSNLKGSQFLLEVPLEEPDLPIQS